MRRYPELLVGPLARQQTTSIVNSVLGPDPLIVPALGSSCVAIRVGGAAAYAHNPTLPLIAASTMKTLTAAALLAHSQPHETLTTRVVSAAAPRSGVVAGDLWLVGGGDPVLATEDYLSTFAQARTATPLGQLADRIAAAGIKRVTGGVVGDDRRFDDERSIPSWKHSYLTSGQVGPLSALNINDGFTDGTGTARRPASDPPLSAAALFTLLLIDRGIQVDGVSRGRPDGTAAAPKVELASIHSPPISMMIAEMLQHSDNTTAELLLKETGRRASGLGTTTAGLAAERAVLVAAKLPLDGYVANDGSGLDRGDRVTCALLLANMAGQSLDGPLIHGLSVAGTVGTLRKRMTGPGLRGNVRAKTGTLNGVSALVGVLTAANGTRLDFAMVFNGLASSLAGVQAEDRLLERLAALRPPSAEALAPVASH